MDVGMKTKHCAGLWWGGISLIRLENKLKATIFRMYGSGSSGGWAVAVGGGKEHARSLKEAPVPRDDIQTRVARQ